MAIQLIERNSVAVNVSGQLNDEHDAAKPINFNFTLHCKRLHIEALQAALADKERSVRDFVTSVVHGWAGVQGADGHSLPFSAEGLEQLLSLPGMDGLAFNAYLEQQGARAKN